MTNSMRFNCRSCNQKCWGTTCRECFKKNKVRQVSKWRNYLNKTR